jgi:hypothetical protein
MHFTHSSSVDAGAQAPPLEVVLVVEEVELDEVVAVVEVVAVDPALELVVLACEVVVPELVAVVAALPPLPSLVPKRA